MSKPTTVPVPPRIEDAAEHADSRALAGAVRAEDAEDLALAHLQRDVPDRDQLAEAAREVLGPDDHLTHGSAPRTPARRRAASPRDHRGRSAPAPPGSAAPS